MLRYFDNCNINEAAQNEPTLASFADAFPGHPRAGRQLLLYFAKCEPMPAQPTLGGNWFFSRPVTKDGSKAVGNGIGLHTAHDGCHGHVRERLAFGARKE